MSNMKHGIKVFRNPLEPVSDLSLYSSNKATKVHVCLVFLRIGKIDTLKERYQAQLVIESRWTAEREKIATILSPDDCIQLDEGKSVPLLKYAEPQWHPHLYIENAIGDVKEQIRYTARVSSDPRQVQLCEQRDVNGTFWEKLELQNFPSDIQGLSISIASTFYDDKVILLSDPDHLSGVNQEAFVGQQEWLLYEHVDARQKLVNEFVFRNVIDEDEDNDDENSPLHSIRRSTDRKRLILTMTCHAARQSHYFYWNGYCLVFLITLLSFCFFAIPPHLAVNRIQASCTLLLTSITFRWTVNRSLPPISYLTLMDKYAIMCIFILITLCMWHTTMSALIFEFTPDLRVTRDMWLTILDRRVFIISITIFILIHCGLLLWIYFVLLRHRREMKKKDEQYQQQCKRKQIGLRNEKHV